MPFVLDFAENPHPKMLAAALELRTSALLAAAAERRGTVEWLAEERWAGYLAAMCDATGETPEAIEAWMDRHAQ